MKMRIYLDLLKHNAATCLSQGISPQRLALTLALGFAIGCIPMLGVATALCILVSFALRLNFPAIQAANWLAMPLQMLLIVPFMRLGGRIFTFGSVRAIGIGSLLHTSPFADRKSTRL